MRATPMILLLGAVTLGGCKKATEFDDSAPAQAHGRYSGIGVFDAGRLWSQASGARPDADPATARLEDDEHVIVVVDSISGEVRECGDHSGYCMALNPWRGGVPALPAKLAKHAADLAAEDQAASKAH